MHLGAEQGRPAALCRSTGRRLFGRKQEETEYGNRFGRRSECHLSGRTDEWNGKLNGNLRCTRADSALIEVVCFKDAKARRLLWDDIISLTKENRVVILTSHSMEECEVLCTRLVIMVNVEFKCLGSPQYLKSKFGNGFKLKLRLYNETQLEQLYGFMKMNFPASNVTEKHKNLVEFTLPFQYTKLSQIFGLVESNRNQLNIKDYSVGQTTLDQVFVDFAKHQDDDAQLLST